MLNTTTVVALPVGVVTTASDVIQLTVRGNSTQTSSIFLIEKSDGTDLLTVSNAGQLALTQTGNTAGVLFGGDTNLYRDGADTLKTDDFFVSGGLATTADSLRVVTAKTPASAAAAGDTGQICWDASFLYVCVSTNTWKRVAIATW